MPADIPKVVIERLPIYARALSDLAAVGTQVVSSQELGTLLDVTPAQIRKDLSYFGRFGKQGRGYNVRGLLDQLREILGLDRRWTMVLVGVGRLGDAILSYRGFAPQGFEIVQAFDIDPSLFGQRRGSLVVKDVAELKQVLGRRPVDIGIVAVPASAAQDVVDKLVDCDIRAILNYAPVAPHVPSSVHVWNIDPVLALQSMTFYLRREANAAVK